jgi:hypothetical protein
MLHNYNGEGGDGVLQVVNANAENNLVFEQLYLLSKQQKGKLPVDWLPKYIKCVSQNRKTGTTVSHKTMYITC